MPRGDGTGPMGYGPMTGHGLGHCAGYLPGFRAPMPGRFRGRGRRFWGYPGPWIHPGYGFTSEKEALEEQVDFLKKQVKEIESRLEELKDSEE